MIEYGNIDITIVYKKIIGDKTETQFIFLIYFELPSLCILKLKIILRNTVY